MYNYNIMMILNKIKDEYKFKNQMDTKYNIKIRQIFCIINFLYFLYSYKSIQYSIFLLYYLYKVKQNYLICL